MEMGAESMEEQRVGREETDALAADIAALVGDVGKADVYENAQSAERVTVNLGDGFGERVLLGGG